MPRLFALVVSGLLLLVGGCNGQGSLDDGMTAAPAVVVPNATVDAIVDGDTIDVVVGDRAERVRMIGIDTPEIAHPSMGGRPANPAECFGDEAEQYTASLLTAGTPVRLERDVVARDDYGRLLAYVYRASDGIFVNYEIVRHGYAQPLTIAPNDRFAELIVDATRRAETDEVGLWSACRDR